MNPLDAAFLLREGVGGVKTFEDRSIESFRMKRMNDEEEDNDDVALLTN